MTYIESLQKKANRALRVMAEKEKENKPTCNVASEEEIRKEMATEYTIEQVVGEYWLKYAESALKQDVEPSLFSTAPYLWIVDACASAKRARPADHAMRFIVDRTTAYIVKTLYSEPLRYPRVTQWMVRRAMSK